MQSSSAPFEVPDIFPHCSNSSNKPTLSMTVEIQNFQNGGQISELVLINVNLEASID